MPDIDDRSPKEVATKVDESKIEPLVPDHDHMLNDTLRPPSTDTPASPKAPGEKPRFMSNQTLANELMGEGLMPALDRKDVPETLARAAVFMNNKDLGVASDRNMSSGTAVSRLLQFAGAGIEQSAFIPNLKQQLEAKGWESHPFTSKEQLKPGDLLFTSMDPQRRNVGVVGIDGKIYSHNFNSQSLQGRDNWSSKFTTVMRQKGIVISDR